MSLHELYQFCNHEKYRTNYRPIIKQSPLAWLLLSLQDKRHTDKERHGNYVIDVIDVIDVITKISNCIEYNYDKITSIGTR